LGGSKQGKFEKKALGGKRSIEWKGSGRKNTRRLKICPKIAQKGQNGVGKKKARKGGNQKEPPSKFHEKEKKNGRHRRAKETGGLKLVIQLDREGGEI